MVLYFPKGFIATPQFNAGWQVAYDLFFVPLFAFLRSFRSRQSFEITTKISALEIRIGWKGTNEWGCKRIEATTTYSAGSPWSLAVNFIEYTSRCSLSNLPVTSKYTNPSSWTIENGACRSSWSTVSVNSYPPIVPFFPSSGSLAPEMETRQPTGAVSGISIFWNSE